MPRDENDFRDAVASLPAYKRSVAWEYVKQLQAKVLDLEMRESALSQNIIGLEDRLYEYERRTDDGHSMGGG